MYRPYIPCKYNDRGAWCINKKVKKSLFGLGDRCCPCYDQYYGEEEDLCEFFESSQNKRPSAPPPPPQSGSGCSETITPRCDKCIQRDLDICIPQAKQKCKDVYASKECYNLFEEKENDTNN